LKPPKLESEEAMALLEAALYVAGRPLNIETLGSIIGTQSEKKVKALANGLIEVYLKRHGALELIELKGQRFVLQLKPRYLPHVKRLAMRPLLSKGPLKTLAYIAYRQPVLQSQVISVRGTHAYDYIKELEYLGLIKTEKIGRTKLIQTTNTFADYFDLSHDPHSMKRQLKSLFGVGGKLNEDKRSQAK